MTLPDDSERKPGNPISKRESLALLLTSVAMNEISLSHIISAEAEAIQSLVRSRPDEISYMSVIRINNTASRLLEEVSNGQWLSLNKLDRILRLLMDESDIYGEFGVVLDESLNEDMSEDMSEE